MAKVEVLTEELEAEPEAQEPVIAETNAGDDQDSEPTETRAEDDGEEEIAFQGDTPAPEPEQSAPEWVKRLRKEHRDAQRRIRELERERQQQLQPEKPKLPPKPTLESCEWDADRFERELADWQDQKRTLEQAEAAENAKQEEARKAWETKVEGFKKARETLRYPDATDANETVDATLSEVQRAIIIHGASEPAKLMYALGKSPSRLEELSKITDPTLFTFAVARLEGQMTSSKRPATPPEKTIKSASSGVAVDTTLDRLRKEADRTGDRTAVVAYIRKQRTAT